MQLMGKNGVVLGVANERSIAWWIAQAAQAAGARLALNYQNERLHEGVRKLAETLPGTLCLPCDLSEDQQIDRFFTQVEHVFEGRSGRPVRQHLARRI